MQINVDAILLLGIQLADALSHAHQNRIIHGDLKPSNVVMTVDGTPMIVDFNLSSDDETESLAAGGTLPYMAPEQIKAVLIERKAAKSAVTERSDIFSLGAVLYELLTGNLPFGRPDEKVEKQKEMAQVMLGKQRNVPPLANAINRDVPDRFANLVASCLAFPATQRPSAMSLLVDELTEIQQVAIEIKLAAIETAKQAAENARLVAFERAMLAVEEANQTIRRRKFLALSFGTGLTLAGGVVAYIRTTSNPLHYVSAAKRHIRNDKYGQAIGLLNRVLNDDPTNEAIAVIKAQAVAAFFEVSGDHEALRGALSTLRSKQESDANPIWIEWISYCRIHLNEIPVAKRTLIDLEPKTAAIYNNLGRCYSLEANDYGGQAARNLDNVSLQNHYANLAADAFQASAECFEKAIAADPESLPAHLNVLLHYNHEIFDKQIGIVDKRLNAAKRCLELSPTSATANEMAAAAACAKWSATRSPVWCREINGYIKKVIEAGGNVNGDMHLQKYLANPKALDISNVKAPASRREESKLVKPTFVF